MKYIKKILTKEREGYLAPFSGDCKSEQYYAGFDKSHMLDGGACVETHVHSKPRRQRSSAQTWTFKMTFL